MPRARKATLLAVVLLLVGGALTMGRAALRERTPVASTATPQPITQISPIQLEPGRQACAYDVVLTPRTQVAVLRLVGERRQSPPRLQVSADAASGYRSAPVDATIAGEDQVDVSARITPPPAEVFGRLCVRNAGAERVALVGTEEFRTASRAYAEVEDEPVKPDLSLAFLEGETTSLLGFLPEIERRLTAFRGFLGHGFLLWPLTLLVVVGVPAAVLMVLHRAMADDERG